MKNKPIVMEHYHKVHTTYVVDFTFTTNITFLTGDSGQGKLIVVDNADLLLTDEIRKHIALDDKNQYLLIGRDPRNLYATKDNIFGLASEKKGEKTEFKIEMFV